MAFLKLNETFQLTRNILTIDRGENGCRRYRLKIFPNNITARMKVTVITGRRHVQEGVIDSISFNDRSENMWSTLKIVGDDGKNIVIADGDCGGLVVVRPSSEEAPSSIGLKELFVIGIVIGKWDKGMPEPEWAVANRLKDVLRSIGQDTGMCRQLFACDPQVIDLDFLRN